MVIFSQICRSVRPLTRGVLPGGFVYRTGRNPVLTRALCSVKDSKQVSPETLGTSYIPKYQVQPIDRFFLVLTGTMKAGEIPKEISYEMLEKSQNRRRIIVNLFTVFLTFCGSLYMIRLGRRARDDKTEDNMFERNVKRYERLREQDRLKAEVEAEKKA